MNKRKQVERKLMMKRERNIKNYRKNKQEQKQSLGRKYDRDARRI